MFGLAHRAVLLAPAEDAFDHRPAGLRHAIAFVPRGASVDGALTTVSASGDAVVLRHMRRNFDGAQMGHMVSRVIGLIFAHRDAAAGLLALALSMICEARRSAVPLASVTMPATASPCRFSMVGWPMYQSFASRPAAL